MGLRDMSLIAHMSGAQRFTLFGLSVLKWVINTKNCFPVSPLHCCGRRRTVQVLSRSVFVPFSLTRFRSAQSSTWPQG